MYICEGMVLKKFKVIYYIGDNVDIKTKVKSGVVIIDNKEMNLNSKTGKHISSLVNVSQVELVMMHGLGSMLRMEMGNCALFLSVVRCCIAGQFVIINAFGTRKLKNILESHNTIV